VVVEEVIPETQQDTDIATMDLLRIYCHDGFDVALG
jgi:hypothetical protein